MRNDSSAQDLACCIHEESNRPDINADIARVKGIDVLTNPDNKAGGCTSIPLSTSKGFSPLPSSGVIVLTVNGEVKNMSGIKNADNSSAMTTIACGAPQRIFGNVFNENIAKNRESAHVQNNKDPD